MKRRRNAGKAGAAPAPSDPAEGDGHAACRARLAASEAEKDGLRAALSEQGGRLDAAEAAAAELRAANEALAREHAALKQDHDVCLFFARRRDFGAELPAGVLLNIMDRAPSSECVGMGSRFGGCCINETPRFLAYIVQGVRGHGYRGGGGRLWIGGDLPKAYCSIALG